MGDRIRRLVDLVINRVAFVGAGDNPDATIELWKAREEEPMGGGQFRAQADAAIGRSGGDRRATLS